MSLRSIVRFLAAVFIVGFVGQAHAADAPDIPWPTINNRALNKLGWKLSCQAYTFREMSLFETIDTLQKLGIHYIELFPGQRFSPDQQAGFDHNSPPAMVDALIRKLRSAGITPVSYGVVGLSRNEKDDRRVFELGKKLHLLQIVSEPSPDSYALVDRLCREYHTRVAIHDHPKPDYYWSPDVVLKVATKHIGACADTGHWFRSGLWPVTCLQQLKGHIFELHFKDLSDQKVDRPWGTGVCDLSGQLIELRLQRFRGVFSIEYESTSGAELVANVAKCCQYFSDTATKIANLR